MLVFGGNDEATEPASSSYRRSPEFQGEMDDGVEAEDDQSDHCQSEKSDDQFRQCEPTCLHCFTPSFANSSALRFAPFGPAI